MSFPQLQKKTHLSENRSIFLETLSIYNEKNPVILQKSLNFHFVKEFFWKKLPTIVA